MNRMCLVCGWFLDIFWRGSSMAVVTLLFDTSSLLSVSPRSQSATPFHVLMCLEALCIFNCLQLFIQLHGLLQKTCFAIPLHLSFPFRSPSILLTSPVCKRDASSSCPWTGIFSVTQLSISHHFIEQNLKDNKQKHLRISQNHSCQSRTTKPSL